MFESAFDLRRFRAYTVEDLDRIPHIADLPRSEKVAIRAVASVIPFRVNAYVLDKLIDWSHVPDDPIYQLCVPQPGMLTPDDFDVMHGLVSRGAARREIKAAARRIQARLNPHPAGQNELNVPTLDGRPLPGMQHKYDQTLLFFPGHGQICHAYCTYCFRWSQFVGCPGSRFAARTTADLVAYLRRHREVTDVLVTGGDPMTMRSDRLRGYIEPLLGPGLEHVASIRIGTKALSWWPQRFFADPDSGDLLRLFEQIVGGGRQLALMAHYSHPRELETAAAAEAVRAVRDTGAVIRSQAPLIRHVNDSASVWAEMWRAQARAGIVPYYMFVERDTGAQHYFSVPLARAHRIFREAYGRVSGLARTVRGPSMSATAGKILVCGTAEVAGEKVFALQFIQARDTDWLCRPFFAAFDPEAIWIDDLKPAFGESEFFFSHTLAELAAAGGES